MRRRVLHCQTGSTTQPTTPSARLAPKFTPLPKTRTRFPNAGAACLPIVPISSPQLPRCAFPAFGSGNLRLRAPATPPACAQCGSPRRTAPTTAAVHRPDARGACCFELIRALGSSPAPPPRASYCRAPRGAKPGRVCAAPARPASQTPHLGISTPALRCPRFRFRKPAASGPRCTSSLHPKLQLQQRSANHRSTCSRDPSPTRTPSSPRKPQAAQLKSTAQRPACSRAPDHSKTAAGNPRFHHAHAALRLARHATRAAAMLRCSVASHATRPSMRCRRCAAWR